MNKMFISSQSRGGRQERIYEAALEVFAEFGYRKTGMEDIAKRLGLAVGTLYRYAQNKRDLYRKAVGYAFQLWQESAEAAAAAAPGPLERFRLLCGAAFRHLAEEPRLRRILAGDPSLFPVLEGDDPFAAVNRRSLEILEGALREGVAAGVFEVPDPRIAARVLFSLYQLFIEKAYVEEEVDEALLFEQGLDLVLNGLLVRPAARGTGAPESIRSDEEV